MAGQLAIPTFVSGAKDDLAATDVYAQTSNVPINSVQVIEQRSSMLSASGLRGGVAAMGGLPNIQSLIATGKNLLSGTGDPLSRLTSAVGPLSSIARSLQPGLVSSILGGITDATKMVATLNGIKTSISSGNFTNVAGIGNLINTLSNGAANFSILDKGALTGGLSGIINQATKFGLPNSFGSVLTGITDKNIINTIAGKVLPGVVANSDFGSLSSMATLCSPGALKMLNPNVLSDFASNYTAPIGQNLEVTMGSYTDITDTFTKIDPPWATSVRVVNLTVEEAAEHVSSTDEAVNVTAIQGCSPDFQKTLEVGIKSNPDATPKEQALLVASVFPPTDVHTEIKEQFPMSVLAGPRPIPVETTSPETAKIIFEPELKKQEDTKVIIARIDAMKAEMADLNDKGNVLSDQAVDLEVAGESLIEHGDKAGGDAKLAQAKVLYAQADVFFKRNAEIRKEYFKLVTQG